MYGVWMRYVPHWWNISHMDEPCNTCMRNVTFGWDMWHMDTLRHRTWGLPLPPSHYSAVPIEWQENEARISIFFSFFSRSVSRYSEWQDALLVEQLPLKTLSPKIRPTKCVLGTDSMQTKISIWICTARCRVIWVFRLARLLGIGIFSCNCLKGRVKRN